MTQVFHGDFCFLKNYVYFRKQILIFNSQNFHLFYQKNSDFSIFPLNSAIFDLIRQFFQPNSSFPHVDFSPFLHDLEKKIQT